MQAEYERLRDQGPGGNKKEPVASGGSIAKSKVSLLCNLSIC